MLSPKSQSLHSFNCFLVVVRESSHGGNDSFFVCVVLLLGVCLGGVCVWGGVRVSVCGGGRVSVCGGEGK